MGIIWLFEDWKNLGVQMESGSKQQWKEREKLEWRKEQTEKILSVQNAQVFLTDKPQATQPLRASPTAWQWRICLQCSRCVFDPWVGKILWRRKWQLTPVFLPEKFHRQRSLVRYSPWESDTTEHTHTHNATAYPTNTITSASLLSLVCSLMSAVAAEHLHVISNVTSS